ncbi:MAG: hypothetical protein LWW93_05735 [Hyphomicrobiales bacterium]|nr:hypothetical protein [Hyphomicrobiales bacterium]
MIGFRIVIDTPETLGAELGDGGIDIALPPEVRPHPGIRFSPFDDERHSLGRAVGHPLRADASEEMSPQSIEAHAFVLRPSRPTPASTVGWFVTRAPLGRMDRPGRREAVQWPNWALHHLICTSGRFSGRIPPIAS